MGPKTATQVRGEVPETAEKSLSLRYAEIVKLREAIQRAQSASNSCSLERCTSK